MSVIALHDSHAIFYELSGNFAYDKTVYGSQRQNKLVSRTYSGSVAIYLFMSTALELNYSQSEDIQTDNTNTEIVSGVRIKSTQNLVGTEVYGVGLRQRLAGKGAWLRPLISFGYAKQFKDSSTEYTILDETSGATTVINVDNGRSRVDSAFGTFTLQIRLTKTFSINGSVRTVFKAFEFDQAQDNMKYAAGFSWFF